MLFYVFAALWVKVQALLVPVWLHLLRNLEVYHWLRFSNLQSPASRWMTGVFLVLLLEKLQLWSAMEAWSPAILIRFKVRPSWILLFLDSCTCYLGHSQYQINITKLFVGSSLFHHFTCLVKLSIWSGQFHGWLCDVLKQMLRYEMLCFRSKRDLI